MWERSYQDSKEREEEEHRQCGANTRVSLVAFEEGNVRILRILTSKGPSISLCVTA